MITWKKKQQISGFWLTLLVHWETHSLSPNSTFKHLLTSWDWFWRTFYLFLGWIPWMLNNFLGSQTAPESAEKLGERPTKHAHLGNEVKIWRKRWGKNGGLNGKKKKEVKNKCLEQTRKQKKAVSTALLVRHCQTRILLLCVSTKNGTRNQNFIISSWIMCVWLFVKRIWLFSFPYSKKLRNQKMVLFINLKFHLVNIENRGKKSCTCFDLNVSFSFSLIIFLSS